MSGQGRRPRGGPFVMHLDRVCQLIDKGQTFVVEFHPVFNNAGDLRGKIMGGMGLHIMDGGDVALQLMDGTSIMVGLTLANYEKVWRCWQKGRPDDRQRRETEWGQRA